MYGLYKLLKLPKTQLPPLSNDVMLTCGLQITHVKHPQCFEGGFEREGGFENVHFFRDEPGHSQPLKTDQLYIVLSDVVLC